MSITSTDICQAADALKGFVGFNRKTGRYIVRFSEDSFGMDVADDSITPTSEFVWRPGCRISSWKPADWRKLNPLWLRLRIN